MSLSKCLLHFSLGQCEANRDGADAESPFPLFFSFTASFKNSSPREKVGYLYSGEGICSCHQRALSGF